MAEFEGGGAMDGKGNLGRGGPGEPEGPLDFLRMKIAALGLPPTALYVIIYLVVRILTRALGKRFARPVPKGRVKEIRTKDELDEALKQSKEQKRLLVVDL